ncbi:uncharacterized protein LOC122502845 [Leptopilina heterotoma]|uniref:uncharacterized protein LOC122502845 n=1 Tax=Leptopilina heterotoma TaxID=63436 RepID=UPI001CAA35A6|nr:uncharacterized protein LOC122502845 [Leptopilina heterotoma]XP_043469070.1 uncharacterized protein LOC122502845 [Leptopilina heterotoma]
MYCPGTTTGSQATSCGFGSRGGAVSLIRALGVLVCEGRIQGPPRGYKEGPHCAAPMQITPNDHVCEKENYLCERYEILIKEIEDRITIGVFLCVEVLLCSDCPCGLLKTTSKNPLLSVNSKSPWQCSSEVLLEYWCIGTTSSNTQETMNSQGLYQAVRSRLHFSQVAAWWSRSNGSNPVYVATRVVPYYEDHLRKFREHPVEHTFPLASSGDGNSIKVTVWALPRMEDVPVLICPLHPTKETEDDVARALTPTKIIPIPSISHTPDVLVLPALLDDRLQTPCDKSGKHDCRCEEEDGGPPSPSVRPNSERKRRRSLPCGPSETSVSCIAVHPSCLTSVQETTTREFNDHLCKFNYGNTKLKPEVQNVAAEENPQKSSSSSFDNLEHIFETFSIDEQNWNVEKRYKYAIDNPDQLKVRTFGRQLGEFHKNETGQEADNGFLGKDESPITQVPSESLFLDASDEQRSSLNTKNKNSLENIHGQIKTINNNSTKKMSPLPKETNLVINPFYSLFYETNPGSSTHVNSYQVPYSVNPLTCTVHKTRSKSKLPSTNNDPNNPSGKELSQLMANLSFPEDKNKGKEEGILDWISKVPGRVLGVVPNNNFEDKSKVVHNQDTSSDVRVKNLELSQREFNEVLAVLRARTPCGKRRTPVKNLKKKEKVERPEKQSSQSSTSSEFAPTHESNNSCEELVFNSKHRCSREDFEHRSGKHLRLQNLEEQSKSDLVDSVVNKADVLLGAILRTSKDRKSLADISNGARPKNPSSEGTEKNMKAKLEDGKSLPSALNKRLIQIRQLFKREERPDLLTLEDHSKESLNSVEDERKERNHSKKRVLTSSDKGIIQEFVDSLGTSLVSTHNSQLYSTNHAEEDLKGNAHNLSNRCFKKIKECQKSTKSNGSEKQENEEEKVICRQDRQKQVGLLTTEHTDYNMSSKSRINDNNNVDEDETFEKMMVPSALEQERFRRSLENAASMVFHSRTGLPLTSSPAPLRKGSCCFDFDSSLNSVSSKRSALFELNTPPSPGAVSLEETDRETENTCDGEKTERRRSTSRNRPQSHALLGNFEESALNGRLEPVSTVHGFTAELGASGSFCPKHRKLPVTVFFYTLGDNDKVSTPYLAHINLGKKGYQVPRSGTVQVTLLNPLGTVVKMFVVLYDLSDMPPRSHTFLRQRTLRDKTLRYLIHLRFMSGKSGRIYLHTDIRMIICRRADVDTASDFSSEPPQEVRSYNHGPTHPKFSPRC